MRRLLLIAGLALSLAGSAQAGKAIYHTAPSNCLPRTCGYYDFDAFEGSYTYFNVQEPPGTWLRDVQCCSGHQHRIWEMLNWGPPGCFKTSNVGVYYNSNLNTYNAGVLALVNYSCSGGAAQTAQQKAFGAVILPQNQVGDGGSVLPQCGPAWWGSYFTLAGHRYFCPRNGHWWVAA